MGGFGAHRMHLPISFRSKLELLRGGQLRVLRSTSTLKITDTVAGPTTVSAMWVPHSTQNKTTIPKKRIQTERKLEAYIATNPFLNQIFLRSSVPSLGFPHPFGQAGGCGGFALPAHYDRYYSGVG
jgi:hypothetical protein